jgi:hypothetical protein
MHRAMHGPAAPRVASWAPLRRIVGARAAEDGVIADGSSHIRVLLWLSPGMQRTIVASALGRSGDMRLVGDAIPDAPHARDPEALRRAVRRDTPDVVIASIDVATVPHLAAPAGSTAVVFVSTDGRSALAVDGDVSADTLTRLVRALAPHGSDDAPASLAPLPPDLEDA